MQFNKAALKFLFLVFEQLCFTICVSLCTHRPKLDTKLCNWAPSQTFLSLSL